MYRIDVNYWIELKKCPISLASNCCWLNTQEFITCPKYGTTEGQPELNGIWKYNTTLNTWTLYYKYPYECITTTPTSHPLSFDQKQQKIWLYGYNPSTVKSTQINVIPDTRNIGYNSSAVLITNNWWKKSNIYNSSAYHIIGGKNHKKHLKWNAKINKFKDIWTFNDWKKGIESPGLIFIQSKNALFLFGGCDNHTYSNEVWSAKMNKKKIKWKRLSVKNMPELADFGHVSVKYKNKDYILLLGGSSNTNWAQYGPKPSIYIWNIESMEVYPSKVSIPIKGRFTAIAENWTNGKNELLVYGFVRNLNAEYIVDDVMKLTIWWAAQFDVENVRCIYLLHASGRLYKIQLRHLFSD